MGRKTSRDARALAPMERVLILAALALSLALAVPAGANGASSRVPVLIGFDERPTAGDVEAVERVGGRVDHRYGIVRAVAAVVPEQALGALRADPRVAMIEPDLPVRGLDYRATHDWGIGHVNADDVHDAATSVTGAGATVAVVDSGVDCDHPELGGARCLYGKDYIQPGTPPDDDWGHGTHVGGTVAAQRDPGVSTGVVGVAPSASLLAYKVLDNGGYGTTSDVIAAVDDIWNGGGTPKAQVVNMSLGWSSGSTTFRQTMDRAYASGILLVAAAGNGGRCAGTDNSVSYPARYDSVIAVAAVDKDNTRPCWSSTGEQVELSAPGVSVFSTWPADLASSPRDPQPVCENLFCHYKYGSGTSMSVPHVAGAAALVLASGSVVDGNGNGLADEVRQRLGATAVDIGSGGRDPQYGHGVIDALRAVSPTSGGGGSEPVADIALSAKGYKVKGLQHVDLTWSGATANVDVYRDGAVIASNVSASQYTDHMDRKGSGSYTYKVCETGTSVCSNDASVTF